MSSMVAMLVDKSAYFRAGLGEALRRQGGFELVEAHPNEDILQLIEDTMPDVIVLDIDYPSLDGLELGHKIIRYHRAIPVIMLSSNPDDEQLFETTKTGAVAYLDKNTSVEKLTETMRQACRGEYPINDSLIVAPKVVERVLKQFHHTTAAEKTANGVLSPLTKRETQILTHIAHGHSNKQIASILGISEQTIKNHVSAALRKLNANCRAEAVALTIQQGWISLAREVDSRSAPYRSSN